MIRRSALVAGRKRIEPKHLALKTSPPQHQDNTIASATFSSKEHNNTANKQEKLQPLDAVIRIHINKALHLCEGRIYGKNGAAALLQLKPTALQSRMKKLGIRRE